jgi:hypothetical protein
MPALVAKKERRATALTDIINAKSKKEVVNIVKAL